MPSRRSQSGQEAIPKVREWSEALPEVREWSGDHLGGLGRPPGGPRLVGRPSRRSMSHWEALLDVPELSGGPPGGPGAVGRPSRRPRHGREALPVVQEWSCGHLGG